MPEVTPPPASAGAIVARSAAAVFAATTGAAWLWCVVTALTSRFASFEAWTDPDSVAFDPHGYGLLFATLFAVPLGLLCALTLPSAFPSSRRAWVRRRTVGTYAVTTVGLLILVFSPLTIRP